MQVNSRIISERPSFFLYLFIWLKQLHGQKLLRSIADTPKFTAFPPLVSNTRENFLQSTGDLRHTHRKKICTIRRKHQKIISYWQSQICFGEGIVCLYTSSDFQDDDSYQENSCELFWTYTHFITRKFLYFTLLWLGITKLFPPWAHAQPSHGILLVHPRPSAVASYSIPYLPRPFCCFRPHPLAKQ